MARPYKDRETVAGNIRDISMRSMIIARANRINTNSHGAGCCFELWEMRRIEAARDEICVITNSAHRSLFLKTLGMTENELFENNELGWDCDVCGEPLTETELVYSLNCSGTGLCSAHLDI